MVLLIEISLGQAYIWGYNLTLVMFSDYFPYKQEQNIANMNTKLSFYGKNDNSVTWAQQL